MSQKTKRMEENSEKVTILLHSETPVGKVVVCQGEEGPSGHKRPLASVKVFPARSSLMQNLLPQTDKPPFAFNASLSLVYPMARAHVILSNLGQRKRITLEIAIGYDIQHPDKTGGSIDPTQLHATSCQRQVLHQTPTQTASRRPFSDNGSPRQRILSKYCTSFRWPLLKLDVFNHIHQKFQIFEILNCKNYFK